MSFVSYIKDEYIIMAS